ncbi:hypothetical protein B0T22DRAFT_440740 [Podospora appendiculata]|uniref:Uncharacterized protein n=1 Tax=Podospora appendiculata TaxID=314037 RepID=A0AAE1CD65_9PEZI|nr:hypothetical protein B0T22DRAFT_440740 [Podospora appendiculata]
MVLSMKFLGVWLLASLAWLTTVVVAAPGGYYLTPILDDDESSVNTEGLQNLTKRVPTSNSYYPLPIIQAKGKTIIPSPQELLQIIKPSVSSGTCLFYTGLGNGAAAQQAIRNWYKCNIKDVPVEFEDGTTGPPEDPITEQAPRPPVIAGGAGDPNELVVYQSLMRSVDTCNVDALHDAGGWISASASADGFYSQAFAEACTGVVYWFAPPTMNPRAPTTNSVWTQYELPALTSGGRVSNIAYVDLNRGVEFDPNTGALVHPRVIWSQGDSPGTIAAPTTPSTAFRYFDPNNLPPFLPNGGSPECRQS